METCSKTNIIDGAGICLLLNAILTQAASDVLNKNGSEPGSEERAEEAEKFLRSDLAKRMRRTAKDEKLEKFVF